MSPGIVATVYIRNLYKLIHPGDVPEETAQAEMSPALLVGRMSVPAEIEAQFNNLYNHDRLPQTEGIPGYIRARRFEAIMGEPKFITVHEMGSVEVADSPEWRAWGGAGSDTWRDAIRPQMVHAEGSPGVYTRTLPPIS